MISGNDAKISRPTTSSTVLLVIVICQIYYTLKSINLLFTCLHRIKFDCTYRAFDCHCSLHQYDVISRWRLRLMGRLTEFLIYQPPPPPPPPPLVVPSSLSVNLSFMMLSNTGASCNVHRLCSVKDPCLRCK